MAYYKIGRYYDHVNDLDNAVKYYILAGKQGDKSAYYNLAMLYHTTLHNYTLAKKMQPQSHK